MAQFTSSSNLAYELAASQEGKVQSAADSPQEQDPFGDESRAEVKYKTMVWW